MKVIHIGPVRPESSAVGPSQSIAGLVTAQAEIGMDVGLLSSIPLQGNQLPRELSGVKIIYNPLKYHHNPWGGTGNYIKGIVDGFGIPDLVNFHSTYIPFQTALARSCLKMGWPYVITPRGGMTYLAQNSKRFKKKVSNILFFNSYVENAAAIHALCEAEAQDIKRIFKTKKIITMPNGVDDDLLEASKTLQPAKLDGFSNNKELVLGFVGRIDIYHKGLDLLLEALSILRKKSKNNECKLFIVGPYHTNHDEKFLRSMMKEYILQNSIKLLGPKYNEEKLSYFLACDVFVHTSRFEGMPMAVLEAMALGRPCLVTPGTNVADMVVKGGGWQCESDAESIAAAIEAIRKYPKESIKSAGQQAYELVKKDYRWSNIAEKLREEYVKIIESPNG